jgi:hypothetical protein
MAIGHVGRGKRDEKKCERTSLTGLLPNTWLIGPQTMGDILINTMYPALLALMTDPVVLYSAATSGVAAKMDVLEIGDRKAQNERTATMMALRLRLLATRSYISSSASQYGSFARTTPPSGSRPSTPET